MILEVIRRNSKVDEVDLKCVIKDVFIQTDDLWILRNDSKLFKLENHNYTNYLIWTGSETDAKKTEGSIVQLKISCNSDDSELYCIAFRIAGVHVNANLSYRLNDMQWNRIELIICILLTTLLGVTLFGGIALWKIFWKNEKSKLISTMQMQFFYHMKQQQVHMQEQIASIKASIERHPTFENETDQCSTNVGMQKRKLYFSADFFEPELMANPPVLAVQFVCELRKMIDIAKDRIRMKRHVPTLTTISEGGESDEYLEIPRPPSRMNERIDELSPKSVNSVDSGCDSMSDEDIQNQQLVARDQGQESEQIQKRDKSEKWKAVELEGKRKENKDVQPDSCRQKIRQCTIIPNKLPAASSNLMPRSVTRVVQISRIPTTSSSHVTLVTTSQRLNPKPSDSSKTIYDRQNGANVLVESDVSSTMSKLPNSVSMKREPPNLKHILNNVPPPLPKTTPPSTPPPSRNRLYSGRRKAYAVFPNSDLMLKKSLPRRSKRQQRFGTTATAVAVQTLSPPSPLSSSSSVSQSSPQSSSSSLSSSTSSSSSSSSCVSTTA
ncbi:unnamed protein product [Litomosoides sigmodontis]|uniref:Uncharacterized protein n=1 Tax=Litomosoides sigmodontis TaxID=42156 RepID=A0A3P6T4L6_LITSI|nr:unnamed protein product [Litomosoides sigmodontis]